MNDTKRVQCPDLLIHYLDFRIIDTRAWYGSTGTLPILGNSSFDFPRGLQNVFLHPTIAVSVSIVRVFGAWRASCSIAFGKVSSPQFPQPPSLGNNPCSSNPSFSQHHHRVQLYSKILESEVTNYLARHRFRSSRLPNIIGNQTDLSQLSLRRSFLHFS